MPASLHGVLHPSGVVDGFHDPADILGSLWVDDASRVVQGVVEVPRIAGSSAKFEFKGSEDRWRAQIVKKRGANAQSRVSSWWGRLLSGEEIRLRLH